MLKPMLLAVTLGCCAPAQAQIYKWSDEHGSIHYTAIPPTTGSYEVLQKSSAPDQNPADTLKDLQKRAEAVDKAREEAEKQETAKQESENAAEQRAANCEQAKSNLQALESGKIVVKADAQGNKTRLEGEQREEALKQARKDIEYFCNP